MSASSRIVNVWEAAQVKLRGRYSLKSLHAILQHAHCAGRWQHFGVMLLTPLPGLLSIVLMDLLPLSPPENGVFHQSFGFYLRFFIAMWLMAHMMLMQTHESSPTLPLSTTRHWVISLSTGCVTFSGMLVLGWFVAFPTPFLMHISFLPWLATMVGTIYATWKQALATDAEAKRKVLHYVLVIFSAQAAMFFVYSSYTVAFNRIPVEYQTWFTFLLPLIKLGFKNWVIYGVQYIEDLAPAIVVFNVDVFHAIFVSSTMQSANSMGSVVVVMAIDAVQGAVAYYEVAKVFRQVNKLALKSIAASDNDTKDRNSQSDLKLRLGVINYALEVIDTNPRVRSHPDVALPRYRRLSQPASPRLVPVRTGPAVVNDSSLAELKSPKLVDFPLPGLRGTVPRIVPVLAAQAVQANCGLPLQLNSAEQTQLKCVKGVLKMLHMIEFYVLIEFAEAIIPLINAVYMRLLVYLPDRLYYWSLASLTQDELGAKADRVAVYASLELLSFVVFCFLMDRRLRQTSTYQILAFVLQKHVRVAQSALTMWIFFIVQLGLIHIGIDYSFQFKWLQQKPNP